MQIKKKFKKNKHFSFRKSTFKDINKNLLTKYFLTLPTFEILELNLNLCCMFSHKNLIILFN